MSFIRKKTVKTMLTALVISGTSAFCAYAGMNLEADAAVSGIAVALNNYYARMQHPQEALVESLMTAANENVMVITDDIDAAAGGNEGDVPGDETEPKTIYYTDENGVLHEETVGGTLSATEKLLQDVEDKGPEVEITTDGSTVGTVYGTATLRLRQKPDADSRTLTLLALGEQYTVIGYENEFYKIQVDDDLEGYVFKDYIQTSRKTPEQIAAEKKAKEEEAARLKREAQKALEEYEAARKKAAQEEAEKASRAAEEASRVAAESAAQAAYEASSRAEETRVEAFESFTGTETIEGSSQTLVAQVETPPQTPAASGEGRTVEASAVQTTAAQTVAQTTQTATTAATSETIAAGPGALTSAQRTAMVAYAKQFLGGKYVYGGTSLTDGVDCSGFVMRIYEYFGYDIGRTSRDQAAGGRSISYSQLQPGDLIFYASGDTINHVAMYIGNGDVIHASNATNGIIISKYNYRTPCKMCTYLD